MPNFTRKINNMKNLCFLLFALFPLVVSAQTDLEKTAIIKVVDTMFDAMRAGDSTTLRTTFHSAIRMRTYFTDKNGVPRMKEDNAEGFLAAVGTPHDEIWDEKIWSYDVNIDGVLATVWTDYTFFLGDKQLHCGVNTFELFKSENGWVITAISDTRRRENCYP